MRKLSTLIFTLILMSQVGISGEYVDAFLVMGVSGRALAMGNALGALDSSVTAFLSNPSGLAYVKSNSIGLMYTSQFGLANHNYIGIALSISESSTFALSWIRFGVDDIPIRPNIKMEVSDPGARRDSVIALYNLPLKTFGDVENAIYLSYGRFHSKIVNLGWRFSKFRVEFPVGANFKIIQKSYYNLKGYGLGIDIGGKLRASGAEVLDIKKLGMINIGLVLRDVTGTTIYWNTKSSDRVKFYPVLSFALEQAIQDESLILNLAMEREFRYDEKIKCGMEITALNVLSLRFGYINSGLSFGLGLNFKVSRKSIGIDYAFLNHELGANHRVGLGIVL